MSLYEQTKRPQSDTEWFLSKLAVLAASWKLIVIGTAVLTAAGICLVLFLTKPVYSSQTILPLTPKMRAIVHAGLIDVPNLSVSELMNNSGLYSISSTASTPEEAEAATKKALDQIAIRSKPTGTPRDRLLKQIDFLKSSIREIQQTSSLFGAAGAAELQVTLIKLQSDLDGISAEDAILPPTKATRTNSIGHHKFIVIFLISAAFMCMVALLRRHTFQIDNALRP